MHDVGTQHLIDDLLLKPQSFARDELVSRARRLMYHDYKSPYATPEGVLVKHLTRAGFPRSCCAAFATGTSDTRCSTTAKCASHERPTDPMGEARQTEYYATRPHIFRLVIAAIARRIGRKLTADEEWHVRLFTARALDANPAVFVPDRAAGAVWILTTNALKDGSVR